MLRSVLSAAFLIAGLASAAVTRVEVKSRVDLPIVNYEQITGKVYFKGEASRLRRIMMDKDPVCASLHPEGVLPEAAV